MSHPHSRIRARLVLGAWAVLLAMVAHWVLVPPPPTLRLDWRDDADVPPPPTPVVPVVSIDPVTGQPIVSTPANALLRSVPRTPQGAAKPIATLEPIESAPAVGWLGITQPWHTLLDALAPQRVVDSEFERNQWQGYAAAPHGQRLHLRSVIFRSSPDGPWQCAFGAEFAPEGQLPERLEIRLVTLEEFPADLTPRQHLAYWHDEPGFLERRLGGTSHGVKVWFRGLSGKALRDHDRPDGYGTGVDAIPALPAGQS